MVIRYSLVKGVNMWIFKIKDFNKWAKKQIEDSLLVESVREIENGLFDINRKFKLFSEKV